MIKSFKVPMEVYPFDILFSIGQSDQELEKILNGIAEWVEEGKTIDYCSLKGANGIIMSFPKGSYLIRIVSYNDTAKWHSTVAHEIFHAVYYTMDRVGITLTRDSEEAFTYLTGYITEQFYKKTKLCQNKL